MTEENKVNNEFEIAIPKKPTLSPVEVAKILGTGKNAVYESVKRGEIPTVGLGRTIRIPTTWVKARLDEWDEKL
jgi:excisionase family DNA binding protein